MLQLLAFLKIKNNAKATIKWHTMNKNHNRHMYLCIFVCMWHRPHLAIECLFIECWNRVENENFKIFTAVYLTAAECAFILHWDLKHAFHHKIWPTLNKLFIMPYLYSAVYTAAGATVIDFVCVFTYIQRYVNQCDHENLIAKK